ncbi:hypothetical protein VKT23_015586 [Stygiomarasmius scandens]
MVEKTPRRAFLTMPLDGISSDGEHCHSPSVLTSSSPIPLDKDQDLPRQNPLQAQPAQAQTRNPPTAIPTSGSNNPTPCQIQSITRNTPTAINNTKPPLPFVADYKPGKRRPKASDYDSIGEAIILRAALQAGGCPWALTGSYL